MHGAPAALELSLLLCESKSPNHCTNCHQNSKRATKHCVVVVVVIVFSVLVEGEGKVQVSATCPIFWPKKKKKSGVPFPLDPQNVFELAGPCMFLR